MECGITVTPYLLHQCLGSEGSNGDAAVQGGAIGQAQGAEAKEPESEII
jgi:hypothetical protein